MVAHQPRTQTGNNTPICVLTTRTDITADRVILELNRLGAACYITIPGDDHRVDGLHWVTPPGGPPEHVDPDLLRQAAATRGGAS